MPMTPERHRELTRMGQDHAKAVRERIEIDVSDVHELVDPGEMRPGPIVGTTTRVRKVPWVDACPGSLQPGRSPRAPGVHTDHAICPSCGRVIAIQASFHMYDIRVMRHKPPVADG